jgi:hypothetical protein
MVDGNRGNPIVLGGVALAQILESGKNMVCRKFMDEHPEMVDVFQSENQHYVMDVDSLDDLKKFEEKTGWHLQLPSTLDQASPTERGTEPAYLALQRLANKC